MLKRLDFDMNIMGIEEYNESLLVAKCNIFHSGANRNRSFITDQCAEKMTKKIAYIPVVGEWKEQIEDFGSHGGKIEISDEGMKFVDTTQVFGCVLNEPIWKESYDGKDYYCCKVALYKEKFPQLEAFVNERKGQSMELAVKDGNYNEGEDLYYINDATMTALCILGNDVEPCFAPSRISTFSLEDFEKQYQEVLSEVKKAFALDGKEESMEEVKEVFETEVTETVNEKVAEEVVMENTEEATAEVSEGSEVVETQEMAKDTEAEEEVVMENTEEAEEEVEDKPEEEKEEHKKKCELTDEEVFALIEKCVSLEAENAELKEFKLNVERAERIAKVDELFARFDLTEEEKAPLKQKAYEAEINLEVAEEKLFAIMGRKLIADRTKFSAVAEQEAMSVPTTKQDDEVIVDLPYGKLNKYFKKQGDN